MYTPWDRDSFKFAKTALLKYTILHWSSQPKFGDCKTAVSNFNFRMFSFACSKSLMSASFIDALVSHSPKLMPGLFCFDVQFSSASCMWSWLLWTSSYFYQLQLTYFIYMRLLINIYGYSFFVLHSNQVFKTFWLFRTCNESRLWDSILLLVFYKMLFWIAGLLLSTIFTAFFCKSLFIFNVKSFKIFVKLATSSISSSDTLSMLRSSKCLVSR